MKKYSALKFIAGLLKFVGWAIIAIGVVMLIAMVASQNSTASYSPYASPILVNLMMIAVLALVFVSGIAMIASGQLIDLFIDIAVSTAVLPQVASNTAQTVNFFSHLSNRANSTAPVK
jgi:hypothetical protein